MVPQRPQKRTPGELVILHRGLIEEAPGRDVDGKATDCIGGGGAIAKLGKDCAGASIFVLCG